MMMPLSKTKSASGTTTLPQTPPSPFRRALRAHPDRHNAVALFAPPVAAVAARNTIRRHPDSTTSGNARSVSQPAVGAAAPSRPGVSPPVRASDQEAHASRSPCRTTVPPPRRPPQRPRPARPPLALNSPLSTLSPHVRRKPPRRPLATAENRQPTPLVLALDSSPTAGRRTGRRCVASGGGVSMLKRNAGDT
jgi:hypothetical protein